ncbi:hypothetical protein PT273_06270 [Orbaceae bacterium ESL0727]|nr:hypothetical protein [Orbaceae bacterium ESL0727]
MAITTVSRLDMTEVRHMIAEVLSLADDIVLDANDRQNVANLNSYITVLCSDQLDIGTEVCYDGNNELEIASTLKEVTLSVNAYGKNADDLLCKLTESMRFTSVWQRLKRLKMGYLRCSPVHNLPADTATDNQQRAQVDLIFSTNSITQAEVKRGDSVKFNLEVSK